MIAPHPSLNGHSNGHPPSPGEVVQAITGRDYLSHSQVTTYQACPLKFHFTYVEHARPERIAAALVMGSAVHSAIQYHLECHLAADPITAVEPLMAVYRQRWTEEVGDLPVQYGRGDDADTLASTAEQMLQAYLASPESKPTGTTIGVEEAIRFTLNQQLPEVLAKIDHLSITDGHLVVTDFKTTRSMWSNDTADDHADQLHLYGSGVQAIAAELNLPVRLRFVVLTKAKTPKIESININVDPSRVARSTRVFLNVSQAIRSGITYPSPSPMNCSGCPHQQRCDKWQSDS